MESFAATIGFFDGVHLGHRYLLEQLRQEAGRHGMKSLAVTFDRHPKEVVGDCKSRTAEGWQPQLLTTLEEKVRLLRHTGIDAVEVLHFDTAMAAMTAREFMEDVLRRRLGVKLLLTGYDNRFGHGRKETFEGYVRYGRELGMEVVEALPFFTNVEEFDKQDSCSTTFPQASPFGMPSALQQTDNGNHTPLPWGGAGGGSMTISSSLIRRLLAEGDVASAARCLGRPYSIAGTVVHGEGNGHRLGFPTANIMPDNGQKLIPAPGVYAVTVEIADPEQESSLPHSVPVHGMMNIGTRPTFDGQGQTLEVHVFGIDQDLYGHQLRVQFVQWLRGERRFDSICDLRSQLQADARRAEEILSASNVQGG